ncbi:winged helix-turn-helix domain-containing protein [Streptomyces sp. NPDC004111]|uniref:winged helix-turn-helix domain-containing protein n=1 Tax=Streptomyces sp. NPDC004111 TaxID=3364690 RepID=UPI0036838CEF
MRYAQGGGLIAQRRRAGEQLRCLAAERFARGDENSLIAKDLRVTERSVERWRRAWREGSTKGLTSRGSPGRPRLTDAQFFVLAMELAKGPAAPGWKDQRWTPARVKTVIGRRFHLTVSIAGVWRLLTSHGWPWQAPARRALERNEDAGHAREEAGVAGGGSIAAALVVWIVARRSGVFRKTASSHTAARSVRSRQPDPSDRSTRASRVSPAPNLNRRTGTTR